MIDNKTRKIIPRWEWRTFGDNLESAESKIRKFNYSRIMDSSETYILSRESNHNIKIRHELLDVKILKNVNEKHLEQWHPTMKSPFPIYQNTIDTIFSYANLHKVNYERSKYSYHQFIHEIVKNHPKLLVVEVSKKRYGFMIDDVMVEIAELQIANNFIRTIAVEHVDANLTIDMVTKLELIHFENINYISCLKIIAGWNN
jgi:exopolyphosphatase / guanosine-5'-triphosphate,3'-diphosphate pyrophosphatase